jgi:glycosyltransferase involved in cell wall biosynthesis
MKILVALTYYRPHVSGLTIYVERLSRALAARGHQVTVMTSQYDKRLPRNERIDGVHVVRVPVAFRVSKGVIMPTVGFEATRQVLRHDVVSLHLPQFEAWGIALRCRLFGRPSVLTYHCDLRLPKGIVNRAANGVVHVANLIAGWLVDRVIAYTEDYAVHSPFASRYLDKLQVIPPPVEVAKVDPASVQAFRDRHVVGNGPVIGMAARLATEKGVEYLLQALPKIIAKYPEAHVLFAGQHENVLGEAEYMQRLEPLLEKHREHWTFLGVLPPHEMAAFYEACDVTVLPSVNSTESFGLVQIESMICGTPVVASNLPGVRQPTQLTGMGKVVPLRDSQSLADAILEILDNPASYQADPKQIADDFSPEQTALRYEQLFTELLALRGRELQEA